MYTPMHYVVVTTHDTRSRDLDLSFSHSFSPFLVRRRRRPETCEPRRDDTNIFCVHIIPYTHPIYNVPSLCTRCTPRHIPSGCASGGGVGEVPAPHSAHKTCATSPISRTCSTVPRAFLIRRRYDTHAFTKLIRS